MTSRKSLVFAGTFLGPLIGTGTAWLFGNPQEETTVLIIGFAAAVLTSGLMMPVAFRQLAGETPVSGGLAFMFMMMPLIITVSHPIFSFDAVLLSFGGSYTVPWMIGTAINSFLFFAAGFLFVAADKQKKAAWPRALAAAVSMALFYAVITILGARTYTALPQ